MLRTTISSAQIGAAWADYRQLELQAMTQKSGEKNEDHQPDYLGPGRSTLPLWRKDSVFSLISFSLGMFNYLWCCGGWMVFSRLIDNPKLRFASHAVENFVWVSSFVLALTSCGLGVATFWAQRKPRSRIVLLGAIAG